MQSSGSLVLWIVFGVLVVVSLVLDLGIHKKHHSMSTKSAAIWALVWVTLAVVFGFAVSPFIGAEATMNYFTAYLLEKALSVDNLFVFIVIFGFFKVKPEHQRRILFWGILGALVMRAIFIFLGVALLQRFEFLYYLFGGFLIYTGGKLLFSHADDVQPEKSLFYRLFTRVFRISDDIGEEGRFLTVENGKKVATRLLLVLAVVEGTDLLFAVDSIPAVLAVTTDPFVVYTSNIFAILGLRALYFLLAGVMARFRYLNVGLALVLAFIGLKMIAAAAHFLKVPPVLSLAVVGGLLGVAIVASLLADRRDHAKGEPKPDAPKAD